MTRTMTAAPVAAFACLAFAMLGAGATGSGLLSDDVLRLWAGASSAGDGQVPLGRIIAAYPTIPFMTTTLFAAVAPDGVPVPAVVAACLLGLLAGSWVLALRDAGLTFAAASVTALLLAFHPALLRAVIGGPADVFLVIFLFLLGRSLYGLRARAAAPEVMAVGLALLGLAFSHPFGAAIAFAAVPFLAFAVPPRVVVTKSAFNIVVALVFPTIFAICAFVYVSWVFPGNGWSFLAAPAESLSQWSVGMARVFGEGLTGSLALDAAVATAATLALGAPVVVVALALVRRRRPLVGPALVFAAIVVAAAATAVATGLFGDPIPVAGAAPVLAAVVVMHTPIIRERFWLVIALLAAGWLGGATSVAIVDPASVSHARALIDGSDGEGEKERTDTLALGGKTGGHTGVLVDTGNAPAVVMGRGHARGLFGPLGEPFTLALVLARIETPLVAVPDPQSALGTNDRLNRAFPMLHRNGAPGYRLVYQNQTWRLFQKSDDDPIYKY